MRPLGRRRLSRLIRRNRLLLAVVVVATFSSAASAAAASYLVLSTTNTATATTTLKTAANAPVLALKNTNSGGGTSAAGLSITVPSGRHPISVNAASGKATNLNADELDGHSSAFFGQVRGFAQSTNTVSDITSLASLGGLTVSRDSDYDGVLHCYLFVSSGVSGHYDASAFYSGTTHVLSLDTPRTSYVVGVAYDNGGQAIGQVVFVNLATNRAVTVQFAIYNLPGNGGCRWTGTMSAAV